MDLWACPRHLGWSENPMVRKSQFTSSLFYLWICIGFTTLGVSCEAIRPANEAGGILDASSNVSAGVYWPGGSSPSVPIFIRHFYYVSGSSGWSIVSAGANGERSKFEEAGVYALTGSGGTCEPIADRGPCRNRRWVFIAVRLSESGYWGGYSVGLLDTVDSGLGGPVYDDGYSRGR